MLNQIAALPHRIRYWMTPLLEQCPEVVFPRRDRQIQVYVVGMPRSGTVSLFDVFQAEFRADHEPESRFLTRRIVDYREGSFDRDAMRRYLRRRDRRLGLELDTSYLNGEVADILCEEFPQARFILTIRDALGWSGSMMNFLLNKPEFMRAARKPHIRRHMEVQFGKPPYQYAPEEELLREKGLHPLACYLKYWNEHNSRVINSVPAERLLVIKTADIGASTERMETFLQLPGGSLRPAIHSNAAPQSHSLLEQLDPDFVRLQLETHCGDLMRRYFPERMRLG